MRRALQRGNKALMPNRNDNGCRNCEDQETDARCNGSSVVPHELLCVVNPVEELHADFSYAGSRRSWYSIVACHS